MTFWQWVAGNKAAIILVLWIIGTAIYRALPAKTADFTWGQFILDSVRGVLGFLPQTAPKLTAEQRAVVADAAK